MRALAVPAMLLALSLALVTGCADKASEPSRPTPAPSPDPSATNATTGPVADLHLECQGDDGPAVVLVAGLNTSGDTFAELQKTLAPDVRTCWYDRAGIGQSPELSAASPDPTPASAVEDLRATLAAQGVAPPYVVLGWSYGGLVAQAFAVTHPDELAGMVLEDTSVREQFTDPRMMRADEDFGVHWAEGGREIDTGRLLRQLVRIHFGTLPVVVLSQDARGVWGRAWLGYHDELAAASTSGLHVIGTGSGHAMHQDVPDLVAAAVEAVVAAGRDGPSLGSCDTRFTAAGGRCRTP